MRITRPPPRNPPETIIALIDVVFFLLVFFMLIGRMDATAPFDVTPPTGQTGSDMPSGGVTLSVSATGTLAVDGLELNDAEVVALISDRIADTPDMLVRINAHRNAELRKVLPFVAEFEAMGAKEVVLVVTPPKAAR